MTQPRSPFAYLSAVPSAQAESHVDLGAGRSVTLWRNAASRTEYPEPEGHTLSFYLENGQATRRLDGPGKAGFPGAICVLPQGCPSRWEIGAPFRFAHLHWPDGELRRAYAEAFDRDARLMSLPEITLEERPRLAGLMRAAARAARAQEALALEGVVAALVPALFEGVAPRPAAPLRGGLAPAVRRRVRDRIEERLDAQLRLSELAEVAGLSEFHFARGFAQSMGVAPHAYVQMRRVARAKRLLREHVSIAETAVACGFSSQSHLTRAFRAATGVTPARWRALV